MEARKKSILQEKSERFAERIVKMHQYLNSVKHEYEMSRQVYKSGTSIGANIAEARDAQSGPDFISKMSISLKEANETEYWLKTVLSGSYITEKEYISMHGDNEELVKMLVSTIKTMKRKYGLL